MNSCTRCLRFVALAGSVLFAVFSPQVSRAQSRPPVGGPPSGMPAGVQPPAPRAAAPDTFPPLPGPPIRKIESAQAISTETIGAISQVRGLSDGRVMLNDGMRRRLLIFDSTLTQVTIVLDSLTEVENAYGSRPGRLIPHLADSSLFIDPATLAMLVIDPQGRITRVRAIPFAQHVNSLTSALPTWGNPSFDSKGRLVYRVAATAAPPATPPLPGMPYIPSPADSAFIVGVHLNTRVIDTLGVVRVPKVVYSMRMEPEGYYSLNSVPNPLPLLDDWAVMSDGSVAFVRGVDYRAEFRAPDGVITSGEKLPFPWMRMDDTLKSKFADSAKAVQVKSAQTNFVTQMISWSNVLNKPYPASFSVPEGYVLPPGMPADWILPKGLAFPPNYIPACPPGVAPTVTPQMMSVAPSGAVSVVGAPPAAPAGGAGGAPAAPQCTQSYFQEMYGSGYTPPAPIYRAPTLVRPADIPDYKPPVSYGAARADADGNLWVRANPMRPMPGGQIYDVINRKGEMIDRIQLPMGFTLVGFGEGKIVYLSNRDAKGLHLSRVRLK